MTSPEPTVLLISSIPELIPLFIVPRVDGLSLLNVPLNVLENCAAFIFLGRLIHRIMTNNIKL